MTKHRSVVTGWDPAHVNPDSSTGRPKGVQTASDMRIMTTFDVLGEGIFAAKGIPAITGSPTNSASISPFMAAIASPLGGFYVVSIDAAENFTINLANVGAVKVYVQQEDYQVDNTKVDSNVVIGVVYGANPIPANSLLLFTTTITAQTSTNGLTFTPAFKYTGNISGITRVPTQADLANITSVTTGQRALVTTTGGSGTKGEYFYTGSVWQITTTASPAIDSLLTTGWIVIPDTHTFSSYSSTTRNGVITVPAGAASRYSAGQRYKGTQATGGTKFGIIVAVADTAITVHFPAGVTLANEAITAPAFSPVKAPLGFPLDPNAWYIYTLVTGQTNQPYSNNSTWYNIAGVKLDLGVGVWNVEQNMFVQHTTPTVQNFVQSMTALSTNTSSPSNIDFTHRGTNFNSSMTENDSMHKAQGVFNFSTPTSVYQIIRSLINVAGNLYTLGDNVSARSWLRACSAYL